MKLSVIVPILNEETAIEAVLRALQIGAPEAEKIVVDGGSADRGPAIAGATGALILTAPRGRARQMNAGARAAAGDTLAFVHADTIVPRSFAADIEAALADPAAVGGRFDLSLDRAGRRYRMLAASINIRSRLMRSATGDQAIFARRAVFQRLGGFRDIELCEDVDFARRLRRAGRFACVRSTVMTSARRWERDGMAATILRMWLIKGLFLSGVPPALLKRIYADIR